ncbi:phosphatidylinositol-4- kinase, partial [Coemansia sp. RSA 2559]
MECLDLHSLILEELSEVLSITCAPETADSVFVTDPAILKVLAQCPPLPESNSIDNGKPRTLSRGSGRAVTKRQEDAILALAKLLSQSSSPVLRKALLDRVLSYLDALPKYSYSFSPFGVDGVPGEHWFLQRFIGRLLACAASSPDHADSILEHIWSHMNQTVDVLETTDVERIVVFALPALLGSMEALEMSPFRYRASDVSMADALSARLLSAKIVDNIHKAIGESYAATVSTRRTVSLYLQSGVGLSTNHVLAQFLLVLRAILESRIAVHLVECGDLDDTLIRRKDPHQLWELMSQIGAHRCHPDGDRSGARLPEEDGLNAAYSRILSFSLRTYGETRSSLLLSPTIAASTVSAADSRDAGAASRSMLATSMSIMYRSMYASTLA